MVHPLIAIGTAAVGVAKALDYLNTSSHDRVLKKSYKTVKRNTSSSATIYVDHINPSGSDGNPRNKVDGISGVPDIVVKDFPTNLIIEIEDAEGLQRPQRAIDQLDGFSKSGTKRVLVVPDAEETLAAAEAIVDEVQGSVAITTPKKLANHL